MSEGPEERQDSHRPRVRGKRTAVGGVSRRRFERLVDEALREIPEPFRSRLENVAIVVEDWPRRDQLSSLDMDENMTLLGLYEGIPLTARGDSYNLVAPDKITLFRRPIMDICRSPAEIRAQVRTTVLHEVAHYYGIDDEELDRMGYT
jgi:predicted Zn-dependent protease with MMP-like domain